MNKILLGLSVLLLSFQVSAFDVTKDCKNLTTIVCQQLASKAADEENISNKSVIPFVSPVANVTPDKFKEWGLASAAVGGAIGDGLVTTAGKLGIEANKFADSPVGKFSMFLIFWSVAGKSLLPLLGAALWGSTFFVTGVSLNVFFARRLLASSRKITVEYTGEKTWYGKPILKKSVEYFTEKETDYKIAVAVVSFVALLITSWATSGIV